MVEGQKVCVNSSYPDEWVCGSIGVTTGRNTNEYVEVTLNELAPGLARLDLSVNPWLFLESELDIVEDDSSSSN